MKYPYRFKLLLSLLFLFSGTMALAQTPKNVVVRTGRGPAASFVGDAHDEVLKQMLEKHKGAVTRREALNVEKTARAAGAASVRKPRLTNLAASITVTSTNDEDAVDANSSPVTASGDTTLRSAIEYAGVVTVDTIFVPAGTYSLDPALSQLNVEQPMVIQGAGAGSTIISAGHNWYRVFEIDNGPVTIADLTVTQGYIQGDNGGGISVYGGPVELDSVDLSNNQAQCDGGGLAIEGTGVSVTAKYCTFSYDSTTVSSWGYGGAICNDSGSLSVDHCIFRHNYGDGASGAIYITAGDNVISNCVVDSNYSPHGTGGITGAVGSTTMTLTNDTVRWNYGGGIGLGVPFTMRSCVINYNTSGSAAGISIGAAPDSLFDVTINGNSSSGYTGGVDIAKSPVYFSNVSVDSNSATGDGGGIYDACGGLKWDGGSLSKNAAGSGGGIYFAGSVNDTLSNITVTGNSPDDIFNATGGAYQVVLIDVSLAVQATDFVAKADNGSVTLSWKTQSEVNNAGFNVLRQQTDISGWQLAGSYTSDDSLRGLGTNSTGRDYDFTDNKVTSGNTYTYKIQSVSTNGTTKDLSTLSVTVDVPKTYALYQNYPNPFNPSTTIRFGLKEQSTVTLEIYNVLGQRVEYWNYGNMSAGSYNEDVNMSSFGSGVYFYRITAEGNGGDRFEAVRKLMLVK